MISYKYIISYDIFITDWNEFKIKFDKILNFKLMHYARGATSRKMFC
jgi:hypothetical protein